MYTSPKEVEIVRNSGLIQNDYCKHWATRYHSEPFIENDDLTAFAFLAKNFGLEKGKEIVRQYLRMNDDWFLKNVHSPKVLRNNINKILPEVGKRIDQPKILIKTPISCDKCHEYFDWLGDPADLAIAEKLRPCPKCS